MSGASSSTPPVPHAPRAGRPWASIWPPLVFLVAAVPLILVGLRRGRGQFDEEVFHFPTIRRFAWQIGQGRLDLSDYLSATTPGYHLLLAQVSRWVGDQLLLLKLVSSLFTVALLGLLGEHIRRRLDTRPGPSGLTPLVLAAPLVGSMYVFVPGVWLQPDNAGWLGVLIILLLALRQRWDALSLVVGGTVLLLLVWVRQSHIWAAGLLWIGAWIGGAARAAARYRPTSVGAALGSSVRWFVRPSGERVRRLAVALLVSIPAFGSLAWFHHLWHGLTPPAFREQHGGGANPATPAFAMSLFAVYSCFFGAWIWPGLLRLWQERRAGGWLILLPGLLLGIIAAAVPKTTFVYEARATGLWNVVRAADRLTIHGHTSPIILVLAPAGMVALSAWLVQLPRRRAWTYGLALLGFVLAQTANTNAWQRYLEPMFLLTLAMMAADLAAHPGVPLPNRRGLARARILGPVGLGVLGALLTVFTLWSEPVFVKDWPDHPLAAPPPAEPGRR